MLQLCLFSIIKFIINDIIQICVHKEERSSRYIFNKKKLYICYNLFLFALIFYFFFLSNKRIKRSQIPIYVSNL